MKKTKLKKTVIYRVFTLCGSVLTGLIITGNLIFSIEYTILWEVIINSILHYLFECVWEKKDDNDN